jgi:hypothetical protein
MKLLSLFFLSLGSLTSFAATVECTAVCQYVDDKSALQNAEMTETLDNADRIKGLQKLQASCNDKQRRANDIAAGPAALWRAMDEAKNQTKHASPVDNCVYIPECERARVDNPNICQ